MDKELKVRKLASASVRRQRSQEREAQRQALYEERKERKRKMMRMSEIYSTDGSDSSRPNSPENDSSTDTPSECNSKTPEDSFSPDVEIVDQLIEISTLPNAQKEEDPTTLTKPTLLERRHSRSDSIKQIVFGPSLNRLCDFRYDRFSTIIDPIDLSFDEVLEPSSSSSSSSGEEKGNDGAEKDTEDDNQDEEEDDDGEDDDDDDDSEEEDYSPIELATPVAIRMPISRPSVISVVGTTPTGPQPGPHKFLVTNINTIMVNPPKQRSLQPRIVETTPTPTQTPTETPKADTAKVNNPNDYGFPVVEAKPVEVATPTSSSVIDIEPFSAKSLPVTSTINVDSNLKKKSSMPMLTKFTHARMHSIKNFMKPQSISGPPPAVPMIPSTHQPRPSESLTNILLSVNTHRSKQSVADKHLPPSPRRSLTEPNNIPKDIYHEQRPQTARMPSQSTIATLSSIAQSDVTALPSPKSTTSPKQIPKPILEEPEPPSLNRKKSFPNFRRRSGSLGQALKFGNSGKNKPPTPEEPLPPMPVIKTPTQESVQSMNFPTPPARTPRPSRKSGMMYSPFPPPSQKGEPVGLGLRM